MGAITSKTRVSIKYKETEALRNTSVDELIFKGTSELNALHRGGLLTIGDVLDNWNDIRGYAMRHCDKICPSIGETKVKNIKAAVFAYLCNEGYVNLKQDFVEVN